MIQLPSEPRAARTAERRAARMMVIDGAHDRVADLRLADLAAVLDAGDVVVLNDAATLPASLAGERVGDRAPLEARLLAPLAAPATGLARVRWQVALFGAGDWRTPTEARPAVPRLAAFDELGFAGGLAARVAALSTASSRLVTLDFLTTADAWPAALYRAGRPVQYAYHQRPLALWDQQTAFAVQPVALEPPSAAMHLTWRVVLMLRAKGVVVTPVTHATGLSSTGDAWLDSQLPFPERYVVPEATAAAARAARSAGRQVVAVGTGAMRALESAAAGGALRPGAGETSLHIGAGYQRRVVTGLLTGMHDSGSSHMRLMGSFVDEGLTQRAYTRALAEGYLWHEYGDTCLVLAE